MISLLVDAGNFLTETATAVVTKLKEMSNEESSSMSPLDEDLLSGNDTGLLYNDSGISMTRNIEIAESQYTPPLERPETYVVVFLFAVIFVVGVLGNFTLVIIFFRHRSMRNIPNTYILSLALADLLVIITCVPLASIVYTTESWTFGRTLCRLTESFKDISIGVSVFTLTALSGERYCAIVNPLRKLQTKPLTVITASLIWVLAIILSTPSLIVSDLEIYPVNTTNGTFNITACTPFGQGEPGKTYAKYVVVAKAIIYYLLPLTIIGVLYILMARRLHISAREMPGETLGIQSRSQARARRHVARMVVAFVVFFFVCFLPIHVFELWFYLYPTAEQDFDEFWHAIRIIGFCSSFLNSCINPVALYFVSGVFRQHFNRYLCCLCVKKQPRLRQHSTATGVMDTSIVSMRRSTYASTYNRASMNMHNSSYHRPTGGGGGGGHVAFSRQASAHHNISSNNDMVGMGATSNSGMANNHDLSAGGGNAVGSGIGIGSGSGSGNNVIPGGNNIGNSGLTFGSNTNGRLNSTPAQSIILNDKR